MKFTIHQSSRQGSRPYNQDRLAYSYSKESLLIVVADGMGGHRHGEVAAQLAVKSLTEAFQVAATPLLLNPSKFLHDQIMSIHEAIHGIALANDLLDGPRTTIVAAVLQHNELHCAHAGDSRLYHFREGKLLYRSEDHSIVQMLYRKGHVTKEEIATHPDRNKIYSCLGGEKTPQISLARSQNLKDGDQILLCTDGLWSGLTDQKIGVILNSGFVTYTVPNLLSTAEAAAGDNADNISAIGLQWGESKRNKTEDAQAKKEEISTATMPLGTTTTILNPVNYQPTVRNDKQQPAPDLTDDDIESAIAEIQAAINKKLQSQ